MLRLGLLFAISWVMGLTAPLISVLDKAFSGRDLILLGGRLFLVGKATHDLAQILVLDIVFSLDSVITAVGMSQHVWVMVVAMVVDPNRSETRSQYELLDQEHRLV